VLYPRYGSITASGIGTVTAATVSFMRRDLMVIHRCDRCGKRMASWFAIDVKIEAANNNYNVAGMAEYRGQYQLCLDCWLSFVNVP
jgi:hypothetical protein